MHRTLEQSTLVSSSFRRFLRTGSWLAAAMSVAVTGCSVGEVDYGSNNEDAPTWEEFLASSYQEPWQDGVFVVNGDEPIADVKKLREYYDQIYAPDGALIVHQAGNADAKWDAVQRKNLTFCISENFGDFKATIAAAMEEATGNWEAAADVDYIYAVEEDGNCDQNNNNVVFDVRMVTGQPYLARAFFPGQNRTQRNVLVDQSSFGNLGAITLAGILRHELGHTLGFRHEHTRPEAGGVCFEDNSWRELTEYDQLSVMHYPQCNGVSGRDLVLTELDVAGAQALYAEAGQDPTDPTDPVDPTDPTPTQGTPQSGSNNTSIAQGQQHNYEPVSVLPGTQVVAQLSGTGDADLYVRFDQAPTFFAFDCRPYLDGSNELCSLDVPAGATTAHIMIDGYSASNYQISLNWVSPQ
jgi:hypothetical protein